MVGKRQKGKICFIIGIGAVFCIAMAGLFWMISQRTFQYSNLMDDESKLKAVSLLQEHKIPQENIEKYMGLADEFNSIPYDSIVMSGWEDAVIPFFSYDNDDGFKHLDMQPERTNCRMSAFILMKDSITFGETELALAEQKDPQSRRHLTAEEDLLHYDRLYANIEDAEVVSSEMVADEIKKYWESAGISFSDSGVQMIMVYGASETLIQNFHTAVAVYAEDHVWLLEKVDPIHPYQFSYFENEEQMIAYMKKRVSDVKYAAIFANDSCLWVK